jgi:hypothetical protein
MMKYIRNLMFLLGVLVITACHSVPLTISTLPVQPDEEVLGEASGNQTGIMLLQFIPIKQNGRFQAAYDQALQSKGADRLVNPTIKERWFWAWILNGYSFTVSGTAVKKK